MPDSGKFKDLYLNSAVTYPCQGGPPVCSNIKAAGPPSPKAVAHRPMVSGSRSSESAVAAAVQPCVSNKMAYHRSRSRGVGARIIRRRKALASICHCSRNRSISLTPITNPSQLPKPANSVLLTNLPLAPAHFTLALVWKGGKRRSSGAAGPSCNQDQKDSCVTRIPILTTSHMHIPPRLQLVDRQL